MNYILWIIFIVSMPYLLTPSNRAERAGAGGGTTTAPSLRNWDKLVQNRTATADWGLETGAGKV